jgi:Lsr2
MELVMAQKTTVQLVDDITGETIEDGKGRTIKFSVDGADYEIDLAEKQADKFAQALDTYVTHARKVGGRRVASTAARGGKPSRDYDPKAVRAWAQSNSVDLPARGRIPADVIQRFRDSGN